MIRRLLIANRGEIAIRIMAACRELGIETVAVYSEADARARHVLVADRAVGIGPAPARDSYLSIPKILDAVRASGADAVHPGYGFLSEDAGFADACAGQGITFVGPPGAVIARMGSKIEARRLVSAAGVPVVPGVAPEDQTDAGIHAAVEQLGLPVLIKASAGGGGKGMRTIRDVALVDESIAAARREAIAAFGSGVLYGEKLIEAPHHVEVQIFADEHGRIVHLFERECSVQRRHQKVIEESPSPIMTPALRERMTTAAISVARAAGYRNAGTIEFLVDLSGKEGGEPPFYFLEMNTRLQVEHPVTEMVTGVDLVRAQLLVASGEGLPWNQRDLQQRGHAIEARIYAEDPARDFLPQAGRVLLYDEPRIPGVRVDSGIGEGDEISTYYDPMIAKVIARAETRPLAVSRLVSALKAFPILGLRTNVAFLLQILEDALFERGEIDTGFLDREGLRFIEKMEKPSTELPEPVRAVLSVDNGRGSDGGWDPWQMLSGWRQA